MDLSIVLDGWPYDEADEARNIRKVVGVDGRMKLQIRLRNGVVQWEVEGRPDGACPHGLPSALDWCRQLMQQGAFVLDDALLKELEDELLDYDRRRQAFMLVDDYPRAIADAQHCLFILELIRSCSEDADLVLRYDRLRPRIIADVARAGAFLDVQQGERLFACRCLTRGIRDIEQFFFDHEMHDQMPANRERQMLIDLRRSLRERYGVPLTDTELLETLKAEQQVAIARENYEMAARLRDKIGMLLDRLERSG